MTDRESAPAAHSAASLSLQQAVLLALDLLAGGKPEEAEALLHRIRAADPACADAYYLLGALEGQQGRTDRARRRFMTALALRPAAGEYWLNAARLEQATGRFAAACAATKRALRSGAAGAADSAWLNSLADAAFDQAAWADAAGCYRAVAALQPAVLQPWYNLGMALRNQGRWAAAARAFRAAARLAPDHAQATEWLIAALFHAGDASGAAQAASQALTRKDRAARSTPPPCALAAPTEAARAGRTRRVVALSLWGNDPTYAWGAVENARLTPRYYPGWTCRVYHDDSVAAEVLAALDAAGAERVVMPAGSGPTEGLFWRFLAADDPGVDLFVCRDADSRLNAREAAAAAAWLASGLPFHVMRDHPMHSELMLAGMWGGTAGLLPPLAPLIRAFAAASKDGRLKDQRFLACHVWPLIAERCLVHDSAHPGHGRPFPPVAIDPCFAFTHVGAAVKLGR